MTRPTSDPPGDGPGGACGAEGAEEEDATMTRQMTVARADWLAARQRGIGASEAADLIGWGRGSPLGIYARKVGAVEETADTEPMWWGRRLEPIVGERYAEISGRPWRPAEPYRIERHAEHPWALATLDGWTSSDGSDPEWPLEIKTAGAHLADAWAEGPPPAYLAQVQWQMAAVGADRATIACLIGNRQLVWTDVERDDALIARLLAAGAELWARIEARDPPPPTALDAQPLARLYPRDDGTSLTLPAELTDVDAELERMRAERVLLDGRIAAAENRIKAALGSATTGVLGDVVWTWRTQQRAEHVVRASTFRVLRRKVATK